MWTLTNLTTTQVALLAAMATVLSAVIAGTFALVTALINSWSSRRAAELAALRDFRTKTFQLPFESLYRRTSNWNRLHIVKRADNVAAIIALYNDTPTKFSGSMLFGTPTLILGGYVLDVIEHNLGALVADEHRFRLNPLNADQGYTDDFKEDVCAAASDLMWISEFLIRQLTTYMYTGKTMSLRQFERFTRAAISSGKLSTNIAITK